MEDDHRKCSGCNGYGTVLRLDGRKICCPKCKGFGGVHVSKLGDWEFGSAPGGCDTRFSTAQLVLGVCKEAGLDVCTSPWRKG